MRLHPLLIVALAPCMTRGFTPSFRTFVRKGPPIATITSPRRCSARTACSMVTSPSVQSRLHRLAGVLIGGALLSTGVLVHADVARADISYSPRCISGEGAQCEDLAEGNDLIKSLQAKSALSKERYFQDELDTYNFHNFKDYFRAENKHMVKHKDGKYEILTNAEYNDAEKAGTVKDEAFVGE